ncbi:MAG TPA: peptidylprolyl isomerase, partial [Vicinamibacterales bacterium]|nr:peptidylprolyl isomerase [Vicinamibacterales bacterium]
MKRLLSVALFVALAAACKKTPPPAAATTAAPGASTAAPGTPAAVKPLPAQLPNVIAKVNGETVERWELETAIKGVEGRAGSPIPPERHDEIVRGLIDQLVAFHVLSQEAHARKLDATDTDVQARMGQFKGGFPDEQAFQKALSAQGMTLDQLQKQTRMGLEVSKVLDAEVNSKIAVQDADVDTFYKENTERFKQGETVHASHILISVPQGADAATKQAARVKAQQVLKQVKAGGDFAALAKANSQDGSAQNGGDLGFFPKGQMEPTFEQTAFALKPGTTSGLVETPFGFHIIKVLERRPPRTAPLEEVAP